MEEKQFLVQLGANIKQWRKVKHMTQSDLASLCETESANMSRIEAGQTNPTALTLRKISRALNVSISDLFQRQGTPTLAGAEE
jgi:transcriptional regulator with XRE-family HTH domain